MRIRPFPALLAACLMVAACQSGEKTDNLFDDNYSRGIGIYPGNRAETFAPRLVVDNKTYRNVAALKTVYHSSSIDYNLTGQLITDGIVTQTPPAVLTARTKDAPVPQREIGWLFDRNAGSRYTLEGTDASLQIDYENLAVPATSMVLTGSVAYEGDNPNLDVMATAMASADGADWQIIEKSDFTILPERKGGYRMPDAAPKSAKPYVSPVKFNYPYTPKAPEPPVQAYNYGKGYPSRNFSFVIPVPQGNPQHFKVNFQLPNAKNWTIHSWQFFDGIYGEGQELDVLPSHAFTSAWESATSGSEWVYVDLGAKAKFDKIALHWINKATKGKIQGSDDAEKWNDLADLPGGADNEEVIAVKGNYRYVRLLLTEAKDHKPYILSEMEVFGKGGLVAQPVESPAESNNKQLLSGGNWKLQRASQVTAKGEELSTTGFNDSAWVAATVPGTVLSSYLNIGALPDPNFADNQLQISESFFLSNFWYRDEFEVSHPAPYTFLNFDGINWKANIYLNGQKVDTLSGAFMRGKFDVSKLIVKGKNALAIEIVKNAHPGVVKEQTVYSPDLNGGVLGADNPTYHASIGWDWIPTIRGRNIGIWNDVYLTYTGPVTIENPFVRSELPLPDTSSANVFAEATVKNHANKAVKGILKGTFGTIPFEQEVELQAGEEKLVRFDKDNTPALHIENPKLWWPVGYGEPYLYDVNLQFMVDNQPSDATSFKSGIRQMTFKEEVYDQDPQWIQGNFGNNRPIRLSLYVNGRRFIGFGGNWGFGESNLNYRAREYDIAVALHADMHFTMIRNWVGQIGDEEFYEACDKYGVMVWQDFWLANPVDGPDPYDNKLFFDNADDYIKRIRNHASIGIYVGRNEGNPPAAIDNHLRQAVAELHPGLYYISHSAAGIVSGGGPYRALDIKDYFHLFGHDKFHSERGMPNVMNYEDLVRAFGSKNVEPVSSLETPNPMYGLHDYCLGEKVHAAQQAESFNNIIAKAFGKPANAKQFAEWAQWINYNGYRAIFEGRSENRRGMLLWMSHPAWPSMVWQTYDYYFDATGGYFGCKKACEPLHIQWNPIREDIEVVNYHAMSQSRLVAKAQLINQDGKEQWLKEDTLSVAEDQTVACFPLEFPPSLSDTYFIKLTLTQNGKVVSENFYVRGKKEEGNYRSLLEVAKTRVTPTLTVTREGDRWILKGTLENNTKVPALMIRLKVVGESSGEMMLPAFYNDNYFFLMPGEKKEVTVSVKHFDTRGEKPRLDISGFNLEI